MIKICSECRKGKPATLEFFYKQKQAKDGLTWYCKVCIKKRQQSDKGKKQSRRASRKYGKSPKGRLNMKKGNLKHRYNITLKQREQMYTNQDGCCAICGEAVPYSKIVTDHNHNTGKIRGLLCRGCNVGMGWFDNKIFMRGAKDYGK